MSDILSQPALTARPRPRSPLARAALVVLGTGFVGLGVVGLFLPLMPTTVFWILGAACYARSSERMHRALRAHPWVGPSLRAWEEHRAIPDKARRVALLSVSVSFVLSILVVPVLWVKALLGALGAALLIVLGRLPAPPTSPTTPLSQVKMRPEHV